MKAMSSDLRHHIQSQGFEKTIEDLIDYADLQAQLHQSMGDLYEWEYWVKSWIALSMAGNQISMDCSMVYWREAWAEHRRRSVSASLE